MAKTNALISCAVTAQLICAFAFAYAKVRFSSETLHYKIESYSKIVGEQINCEQACDTYSEVIILILCTMFGYLLYIYLS